MNRSASVVCLIAATIAACADGPPRESRSSNGASSIATISELVVPPLPDLSRLDDAVQQQVRAEHARLLDPTGATSGRAQGERLGRMGMLLFAAEYHEAAEPFFVAARAREPDEIRWPYYLGHLYRATHQPDRAAASFEHARRLDPRHVPSLLWLGETYLALGRYDRAEQHLAEAVELQPSAAGWFRRGRVALARRDYTQAVDYLERARAFDPTADAIRYQLGLAYRALGEHSLAEQYLRHPADAASIIPADPFIDALPALLAGAGAYLNRGVQALEQRDWPTAVTNLRKAAELAPRDPAARVNLGTALFLSGDRKGARAAFQDAARVAPDLPKARYMLGLLDEAERRDTEAIRQFAEAVRLDPAYLEAQASLADALRRTGQPAASLGPYQRVLALNPAASQARFGYAMALIALGRYAEAKEWLEKASAIHAEQPGFAHALARVLAAAPDDAVRNGRQAEQLVDSLLQSHRTWTLLETRAMVAAELGRFDEASVWQQEAIDGAMAGGDRPAALHMRDMLTRYRRGLPCRTPWRADDPVFAPRPAN